MIETGTCFNEAAPLGRGDHDRHRTVALLAAVEQPQRVRDHPGRLVVLEGDRPAEEERLRVGGGVLAVGDRDEPEGLGA